MIFDIICTFFDWFLCYLIKIDNQNETKSKCGKNLQGKMAENNERSGNWAREIEGNYSKILILIENKENRRRKDSTRENQGTWRIKEKRGKFT